MFQYTICNKPDAEIFCKQCAALEKRIPRLQKGELLQDVDGSEIQYYTHNGKEIKVLNSFYLSGVFINAQIDIEKFFEENADIL